MGLIYADIILKNVSDVIAEKRGYIKKPEVRQTNVRAMVDTGTLMFVINEEVRQILGLKTEGEKQVSLANETIEVCKVTEPVEIHWKNRYTVVQALVLESANEVLLGAIPLEGMDLMVNPVKQELVGAHGEEAVYIIK